MISKEAIDEFKAIWKSETGSEIDDQKALAEATRLLVFMNAIYRPLKKEWVNENDDEHSTTEN
jgi:hypothetical protein